MGIEDVIKIGVATKDMDESYRLFADVLGMTPGPRGPYEAAGMKVGLCHLGDVTLELMEPTSPEAPVAKFIDAHGEGLEHVCVRVSDLDGLIQRLKSRGIRLAQDSPVEVEFLSRRARAIFARRPSFRGVAVQFIEFL